MNLYNLHSKPETLDHHDVAYEKIPKLIWEKYRKNPAELKKREATLAKDPKIALKYALNVLHGPFPAGEAAIAKDTISSYDYAHDVLAGPFPAGEAAIAKDPRFTLAYVQSVLNDAEAKAWVKSHQ